MSSNLIRDPSVDDRIVRRRLVVALGLVFAGVGLLGGRVGYLQLADYQHYSTLSQQNRIRLVAVPPTRGLIYDRNGVLLAENVTAHRLVIIPEQVPDLETTIARLSEIVEIGRAHV